MIHVLSVLLLLSLSSVVNAHPITNKGAMKLCMFQGYVDLFKFGVEHDFGKSVESALEYIKYCPEIITADGVQTGFAVSLNVGHGYADGRKIYICTKDKYDEDYLVWVSKMQHRDMALMNGYVMPITTDTSVNPIIETVVIDDCCLPDNIYLRAFLSCSEPEIISQEEFEAIARYQREKAGRNSRDNH